jgi:FG-GAP-like repeat
LLSKKNCNAYNPKPEIMQKKTSHLIICCFFIYLHTSAQFTEQAVTPQPLINVSHSAAAWGDYNNDNRLDILLTGSDSSVIYTNNFIWPLYAFNRLNTVRLPGVTFGTVSWGDYNNDGYLDFFLAGITIEITDNVSVRKQISKIYKNSGGAQNTFTDIGANIMGICRGGADWGDYDNDGDLDLIIAGDTTGTGFKGVTKIYTNKGNENFAEETNIPLPGVTAGSRVAWADYDKDGDLDFVLTGKTGNTNITKIYKNNYPAKTFTEQPFGLQGVQASSVAWGDYDNDGDEDLIVTGLYHAVLYRNNYPVNSFSTVTVSPVPIAELAGTSVAWGDYDNDGDLDIILSGSTSGGINHQTKIYKNNGGNVFIEQNIMPVALPGVGVGAAVWGDFDRDKDLDILITGLTNNDGITKLYRNNNAVANTPPSKPADLTATFNNGSGTFNWSSSMDDETPQAGLTYNIVISNTYKGVDILSPMSNIETGFRRIVKSGNAGHKTSWTIQGLSGGAFGRVYYCGVQAIDNSFAGSPFTIQKFFVPGFFMQIKVLLMLAAVVIAAIAYIFLRKRKLRRSL